MASTSTDTSRLQIVGPRIDCAVVPLGLGRVLFAGGCTQHPHDAGEREDGFLNSCDVYDSLVFKQIRSPLAATDRHWQVDSWDCLPAMLHKRHGEAAAAAHSKRHSKCTTA